MAHELWEMAKFYDSIELAILCEELLKWKFPKHVMVLGFFVHAAPRFMRVGNLSAISCTVAANRFWQAVSRRAVLPAESWGDRK